jgi:hypothetical protein
MAGMMRKAMQKPVVGGKPSSKMGTGQRAVRKPVRRAVQPVAGRKTARRARPLPAATKKRMY